MISPTVMRGFRLAYGSWKIICILRRIRRISSAGQRRQVDLAVVDLPRGRPVELQDRPPGGRLAAARFANQPQCLALLDVEAHPVHRMHRADLPLKDNALRDREVLHQFDDAQQGVIGASVISAALPVLASTQQATS